jgi:hypothetical protein
MPVPKKSSLLDRDQTTRSIVGCGRTRSSRRVATSMMMIRSQPIPEEQSVAKASLLPSGDQAGGPL